jgi:hypothetical protein
MYNWLVNKCRTSDVFAWCFSISGIILMVLIALW